MEAKSTKSFCQRIMNWRCSSEGDLMPAVLASVLPNFVFQTKETLLHFVMPLRSLRQLMFFLFKFLWCAWIYHPLDHMLRYFTHASKAIMITLLTVHQHWIHWNSHPLQWTEACVDCAVLSCILQWVCLAPGTFVFLMSGTRASGCPGTPPPPGLTDTSSSISLRVWTCCYVDKTVIVTEKICVLIVKFIKLHS